jgi:hypothetical protein
VRQLHELPPRHDPVLRRRDPRRNGKWSKFARYSGVNLLHPATIAPIAQPNNADLQRNRPETPITLPTQPPLPLA